MSAYFQWSLYGTGLCLQTQGPADSCSSVTALPTSKCEASTEQMHACAGPHVVAGAGSTPALLWTHCTLPL